jgi:peptidoglycan hydrolase CwlO-like protein
MTQQRRRDVLNLKNCLRKAIASLCISITLAAGPLLHGAAYAAPISEEDLKIMEQSLSIVEIDRDISKITLQQQDTERSVDKLTKQLADKSSQIKNSREQAGKVIAAYYMGERETLLTALLSVNSLSDFFTVLDYYQLISERNQDILNTYLQEYTTLRATREELNQTNQELESMKQQLLQQRERLVALQQSVESSISSSADPEKLRQMILELTSYWQNVGLYEVRRYFKVLSEAMANFPDYLKDYGDSLTSFKGGYILTIREKELNQFLRSKNKLLSDMSFRFSNQRMIVQGSKEGLEISVEGHYTIENQPQNALIFHIDKLVFNGLELPDTTRTELEDEFDLGFYPKEIVPFIEATEAVIDEGKLTVKLKLSLKSSS